MGPYSNDAVTSCLHTAPQKLAWSPSQEWGWVREGSPYTPMHSTGGSWAPHDTHLHACP